MKKIWILLLLPFFIFAGFANALEIKTVERTEENRYGIPSRFELNDNRIRQAIMTPYINSSEKIYDFAGLLSEEKWKEFHIQAKQTSKEKNYEIVVVTISNLDSRSPREYADDFYDYNDFAIDGILLLISLESRDVYISTSGKGQILFDNQRVNTIIQSITPSLSIGNYEKGVEKFLEQVNEYATTGPSKRMTHCRIVNSMGDYVCKKSVPILWIFLTSTVISLIVTFLTVKKYKKIVLASDADTYLKRKDQKLGAKIDKFLHTSTSRIRITSNSSNGSSSHHSSSGSSHGGGGGKF